MTLVLALGNADQIIHINDRRISANGSICDDNSSKSGHAICDDASFLYAFTGLATYKQHNTLQWLTDALSKIGRTYHSFPEIVIALANEAQEYFNTNNLMQSLAPKDRRLTIMLTGYLSSGQIVSSLISNYQDFDTGMNAPHAHLHFNYLTEVSEPSNLTNLSFIQAIGQLHSLTKADEIDLRKALEERHPAEYIRQKGIGIVKSISTRASSNNTVGQKITTARLIRSDPMWPTIGYTSNEHENSIPLLNQVDLRTGAPSVVISDFTITVQHPMDFSKTKRNAICPCGSRVKFKRCHGR